MRILWLISVGTFLFVTRCGVDEDNHYPLAEKKYGRLDGEDEKKPQPNAATIKKEKAKNPPPAERNEGKPAEEDLKIDPDTLIFNGKFMGKFYRPSLKVLSKDKETNIAETYIYKGFLGFSGYAKEIEDLVKKTEVELIASQTYGDGEESIFKQNLSTPFSTAEASGFAEKIFEGNYDDSGEQEFIRSLQPDNCPAAFVCVDKVVQSQVKDTFAICFRDPITKKSKSLPYGASPGIDREQLGAVTDFGNTEALFYSDARVNCKDPGWMKPEKTQTINVRALLVEDESILNQNPPDSPELQKVDFGVKIEMHRVENDKKVSANILPFIDQSASMQASSLYLFSGHTKSLVKIVKTIRKPLKSFLLGAVKYDGIKVDVHFFLCEDLLKPELGNVCKK